MPRKTDAQYALDSALGNLWALDELAQEAIRFEGQKAGLAVWHRNAADCQRWVAVVAAAGRGGDLPPQILSNAAYFNGQGWRIPETKERSDKWQI